MTGPEHYQAAEQCLQLAEDDTRLGSENERYQLAAAQVHATLALAAATALMATGPGGWHYPDDEKAWHRAAGTRTPEGESRD